MAEPSAQYDRAFWLTGGSDAWDNGAAGQILSADYLSDAATGEATASGVTISYSFSFTSGSAAANAQAPGVTLPVVYSIIPGVASASVNATASGATISYAYSLIAGVAQASSQAGSVVLPFTYSVVPGTASASSSATAPGDVIAYSYSLISGSAEGVSNVIQIIGGVSAIKGTYRRYNLIDVEKKLERVVKSTMRPKTRRERKSIVQLTEKSLSELLLVADLKAPETPIAMRELPSLMKVESGIDATEWRTMVRALAMQALNEIRAQIELQDEMESEELLLMAA